MNTKIFFSLLVSVLFVGGLEAFASEASSQVEKLAKSREQIDALRNKTTVSESEATVSDKAVIEEESTGEEGSDVSEDSVYIEEEEEEEVAAVKENQVSENVETSTKEEKQEKQDKKKNKKATSEKTSKKKKNKQGSKNEDQITVIIKAPKGTVSISQK